MQKIIFATVLAAGAALAKKCGKGVGAMNMVLMGPSNFAKQMADARCYQIEHAKLKMAKRRAIMHYFNARDRAAVAARHHKAAAAKKWRAKAAFDAAHNHLRRVMHKLHLANLHKRVSYGKYRNRKAFTAKALREFRAAKHNEFAWKRRYEHAGRMELHWHHVEQRHKKKYEAWQKERKRAHKEWHRMVGLEKASRAHWLHAVKHHHYVTRLHAMARAERRSKLAAYRRSIRAANAAYRRKVAAMNHKAAAYRAAMAAHRRVIRHMMANMNLMSIAQDSA